MLNNYSTCDQIDFGDSTNHDEPEPMDFAESKADTVSIINYVNGYLYISVH